MQTNLGPVVAELMRTWHSLHTDTPLQDWKTSTRWTQDQTIRVAKKIVLCGVASVTHTAPLDHYNCQFPCMWWSKGWMRDMVLLQCANSWLGCKDQSSIRWSWAILMHWTIMGNNIYPSCHDHMRAHQVHNNHLLQMLLTDILWNVWIWQRNKDSNRIYRQIGP